jgi:hypothetical protein
VPTDKSCGARFFEVMLVIANIATAVLLFPVLKRQHEGLALGFVAARIVECVFICVGLLSVVTVVTLRQDMPADSAWAGHLSVRPCWPCRSGRSGSAPGLVVGVGNGLILGYLMYTSGLIPRAMAVLGMVGGAGILLSGVAVVFGLTENGSPVQLLAALPEFLWELSLGIYLISKGFTLSRLTDHPAQQPR